jgi:signal transduction histidine kinase
MISGDEAIALRRAESAARSAAVLIEAGGAPDEAFRRSIDVDLIYVSSSALRLQQPGEAELLDVEPLLARCTPEATVVPLDHSSWAVACRGEVLAVSRLEPARQAQLVLVIVLVLAAVVGILTALGVLRMLRPLSEVSRALDRVGAGERGVRMPGTGLAELDDLVDRLNAAARDMEDREDTILGRIAVVQEMARMVAHEVRNPLQSLELLTSLIASEEDEGERLELANAIHEEIRTLETVVTRLLRESATKGALRLQRQEGSLAPLVQKVVALRRPQANARGTRLITGALSDRIVPMDTALMKRSIENLVINAMQAVPDRGGEVRVVVQEEASDLLLSVDDNGPGVDPELADQIFEADVTSKSKGTGLGLALVKGVVEAHDGTIRCVTSPMGGARFEIRIPLEPEDTSEQAPAAHPGGG